MASALLYRDFAGLLQNRVELFPAEALPSMAELMTNFALFFGGRDLGDEVLPGLSPWVRIVARPVEFDPGREPELPLPAAVAVARLQDATVDGERFVTAFQTLIGIINVEQAQQAQPMLQLRLGREGAVDVTSARFHTPGPEEGVDMRYNLLSRPARSSATASSWGPTRASCGRWCATWRGQSEPLRPAARRSRCTAPRWRAWSSETARRS